MKRYALEAAVLVAAWAVIGAATAGDAPSKTPDEIWPGDLLVVTVRTATT